jgi:hypothetical protein
MFGDTLADSRGVKWTYHPSGLAHVRYPFFHSVGGVLFDVFNSNKEGRIGQNEGRPDVLCYNRMREVILYVFLY